MVLLVTNLDGATTELSRGKYVSVKLLAWAAKLGPGNDIRNARCDTRVASENKGDATYLRNKNLVTSADTHGDAVAILGQEARANSEDLGLVLLLDTALGQEDARGGLGLGLDALDQDAVQERSKALDVAEDRLLRPESVCCADGERMYVG